MHHIIKKSAIVLLLLVFVAAFCLPLVTMPSKAYANPTYAIGDRGPAGGIIFYYDSLNDFDWDYLEAAPSFIGYKEFSNVIQEIGTESIIGTGQTNTDAILAQPGHTDSAAKLCDEYVLNGYTDWFLPSIDELEEMFKILKGIDGFDIRSVNYLSSTEDESNYDNAWSIHGDRGRESDSKTLEENVWPIRAFSVGAEAVAKKDILKERGVSGKGLDQSPGLEKEFDPDSQAKENAGKKK